MWKVSRRTVMNAYAIASIVVLGAIVPVLAQGDDNAKLYERRQRLAAIKPGMSLDQVQMALGAPDEVRQVPEGGHLEGMRLLGDVPGTGPETERWMYGIMAKGRHARIGYVSVDRNGKVVASIPTDSFARPGVK